MSDTITDRQPKIPKGWSPEEFGALSPEEQKMVWDEAERQSEYETGMSNRDTWMDDYWPSLQEAIGGQWANNAAEMLASEHRRIKAAKEAAELSKQGYRRGRATLRPYERAGRRILPKMENAYNQGINLGTSMLGSVTSQPAMDRLSANPFINSANVALPDYLKGA